MADKYFLIKEDTSKGISERLFQIRNNTPHSSAVHEIATEALHELETGLHTCNVKPSDM